MTTNKEEVSDKMMSLVCPIQIDKHWYGDFGSPINKREIIREALSQLAADFSVGSTITNILLDLKLIGKNHTLTKRGRRYLYWANRNAHKRY